MSFKITIKPSDHQFEATAKESLLEAALRSGINVSYSCNSGSCSDCKARIVSGDTAVIRHHDFRFSAADKLQNYALLCCIEARSDLIIETSEAFSAEDIPVQDISTKVAKLDSVSENHMILHLRTPRSKSLRFLAGQTVDLHVADFPPISLPVASCPCNGMTLQFHLQRNSQHAVLNYIFEELKQPEGIRITGPHGNFTLDESSKRPIVMVAEGTGLAPIKSLIEHAITLDLPQSMTLFWLVDKTKSHYLSNYCRSWELALDCFVYIPLTVDNTRNFSYENSLTDTLSRCPIETEIDLYLAGSQQMITIFTDRFVEKGTPQERIKAMQT